MQQRRPRFRAGGTNIQLTRGHESSFDLERRVRERLKAAVAEHFNGDLTMVITYFNDDFSGELSRPDFNYVMRSLLKVRVTRRDHPPAIIVPHSCESQSLAVSL